VKQWARNESKWSGPWPGSGQLPVLRSALPPPHSPSLPLEGRAIAYAVCIPLPVGERAAPDQQRALARCAASGGGGERRAKAARKAPHPARAPSLRDGGGPTSPRRGEEWMVPVGHMRLPCPQGGEGRLAPAAQNGISSSSSSLSEVRPRCIGSEAPKSPPWRSSISPPPAPRLSSICNSPRKRCSTTSVE
jgi:hypothetical protein